MAATWWWADDKDGGHQNHWVQYNVSTSSLLETAFTAKQPRVDIDSVRFVQLNRVNMYQARKDAPDRRRMVERRTDEGSSEEGSDEESSEDDSAPPAALQPVPGAAASAAADDDDGGGGAAPAKRDDAAVAKTVGSLHGAMFCMSGKLSDTVTVRPKQRCPVTS